MQVVETVESAHQFAGEFGVTALILVAVLAFVGFVLWRLGNRLVDAIAGAMVRIATATEIASQNVVELKHAVDLISMRMDTIEASLRVGEFHQEQK